MRRIGAIFMAAVMMIMLCSCGNNDAGQNREPADENGQEEIDREESSRKEASAEGEAEMGEALSVHYSGGSDLPDEIAEWLKTNGIMK